MLYVISLTYTLVYRSVLIWLLYCSWLPFNPYCPVHHY